MKNLWWNIRYEWSELRYSTELPLVILLVPASIFAGIALIVSMIKDLI